MKELILLELQKRRGRVLKSLLEDRCQCAIFVVTMQWQQLVMDRSLNVLEEQFGDFSK
jgi:hypothetical protein